MTTNENGNFTGKVAFVSPEQRAALAARRRWHWRGGQRGGRGLSEQDNQETARMIEELGRQALAIRCDVTRAEDVKAALDTTVETFGRLDTAFNNAGVEQATAATADISEEEWDRVVAINLRGVFLCMKYRFR